MSVPPTMSVGIMTVATNRYVEYWAALARSIDRLLLPANPIVLHVFTDRLDAVTAHAADLRRVTVAPVEIAPLGWPEASLLRYEIFRDHREHLEQDLLMHLDADMVVVDDAGADLDPSNWPGAIGLVRHPGFRRPPGSRRLSLHATHPGLALRDAYSTIRFGGLGRWETDPASTAFVPRSRRSVYVYGGVWFGLRDPLLAMIDLLAANTRADLDERRIAVWHDESHLNWFAAHHATALLESCYAFAAGFPGLADLTPHIVAVEKGNDRTR